MFDAVMNKISLTRSIDIYGKVISVTGCDIAVSGLENFIGIGSRCEVFKRDGGFVMAEVVSINAFKAKLISFTSTDGIGPGCLVRLVERNNTVRPDNSWLGRVIDAFANPLDDKGWLLNGNGEYPLQGTPPDAKRRSLVIEPMDCGVKVINCFTPLFYGQRVGIFAGSGVGKSVLLSMMARHSAADVKVVGLIGERGREVNEFLENFGENELKNAIIVVSTSDQPAFARKQAANLVMTISEYFRDHGKKVLCIIDSITRFAFAQREIGLLSGEISSVRGYTPSVFIELPKLLERAGTGIGVGSITGVFSVLVEGDDTEEPLSDVLRAILDGHIVLDRKIAEKSHYPAVNIFKSISRIMVKNDLIDYNLSRKYRAILASYVEMEEIINMGLYKSGSNPSIDLAIKLYPKIQQFLSQSPEEVMSLNKSFELLREIE